MTRRERLEAKLEKRREWAAKRDADGRRRIDAAIDMTSGIPMGQPILVGHHSEGRHRALLKRSDNAMRAGCESMAMAKHHEQRADGLETQLETSIFSDDENAVEALEAKVRELEAEAAGIKADNAILRKLKLTPETVTDAAMEAAGVSGETRKEIALLIRIGCAWQMGAFCRIPAYKSSNLATNTRRYRQRIEDVKRRQAKAEAAAASEDGFTIIGTDFVNVTFAEKPARSMLEALKAAGFRWGGGSWCGYRSKLPAALAGPEQSEKTCENGIAQ